MRLATVRCPNPSCRLVYDVALDPGVWHARCPDCKQENRVPGKDASKDLTGMCDVCGRALDDHAFGRLSYACPPRRKT